MLFFGHDGAKGNNLKRHNDIVIGLAILKFSYKTLLTVMLTSFKDINSTDFRKTGL